MRLLSNVIRQLQRTRVANPVSIADSVDTHAFAVAPRPRSASFETADDPTRFARCAYARLIGIISDDDARFMGVPIGVIRLSITEEEQQAAAAEYVLMHAVGACLFTALRFAPDDHQRFKAEIADLLANRFAETLWSRSAAEIERAIDDYLRHLNKHTGGSDVLVDFSDTYFGRVFVGNPNRWSMQLESSIAQSPFSAAIRSLKAVHALYCDLKLGQVS